MSTDWSSSKIRKTFIDYFVKNHGHTHVPSSSVVPRDDPTLLFANAGMNQFKSILLGNTDPNSPFYSLKRAVNSQKCIRAGGKHNDLEDAGKDTYHHTFFEMLGNWSFGDYFKKEAIDFAWDLLTNVFKLNKNQLYATYFEGNRELDIKCDEETKALWARYLPENHIIACGMADNFWEMGETGPCGPCTELHYDFCGGREASQLVNNGDPEVIEIWNLVFVQFNRKSETVLESLPSFHVDTGMGFERLVCVLQGKKSNYDTDLFFPLFDAIKSITKFSTEYKGEVGDSAQAKIDDSYRIVADHVRCLTVAISDDALPENIGRGYVLRRILRRAVRAGKTFFEDDYEPFLYKLVPHVAESLKDSFGNILEKQSIIQQTIKDEEISFINTLHKGEQLLTRLFVQMEKENKKEISGTDLFVLYSSFGYPIDLALQMAREKNFSADIEGFKKAKEEDRELSRAAASKGGDNNNVGSITGSEIKFYRENGVPETDTSPQYELDVTVSSTIVSIKKNPNRQQNRNDVEEVDEEKNKTKKKELVREEECLGIVLDISSFYAESGGQTFDTGYIRKQGAELKVTNTQIYGGYVLHSGYVIKGSFTSGDKVECHVDYQRRRLIMANHTMTHVLNHSLREVCGSGLDQKGSRVLPEKFTFDIKSGALTIDQISKVEKLCQNSVDQMLSVYSLEVDYDLAKTIKGLRAVFGETYPKHVRVVSVGMPVEEILKDANNEELMKFSIELCGGTHLSNTKKAKSFCVVSESGIAKGIRRLVCLTGDNAVKAISRGSERLEEMQSLFALLDSNADKDQDYVRNALNVQHEEAIPYLMSKDVDEKKKKLHSRMKDIQKKKETLVEESMLEIVRVCSESDQENNKSNKQKSMFECVAKSSDRTLLVYVDALANMKSVRKVLNSAAKHTLERKNVMLFVRILDKKADVKLCASCFVPDRNVRENKFDAEKWIRFSMEKLGGKGSGNKVNGQGQSEVLEVPDKVVDEIVNYSDVNCQ